MAPSTKRIQSRKKRIIKKAPPLKNIIRGTFIEWYQVCARKECKCHKDRKYRHGPYYRISYSKDKRSHHVYVPKHYRDKAKEMVDNYNAIKEAIEEISALNIELIRTQCEIEDKNEE